MILYIYVCVLVTILCHVAIIGSPVLAVKWRLLKDKCFTFTAVMKRVIIILVCSGSHCSSVGVLSTKCQEETLSLWDI